MFVTEPKTTEHADEFRNGRLDYNFRRSPIKTWLKMMFPHFRFTTVSNAYCIVIIFFYIVQLILWMNNNWS
jgi:hypothetical protein